MLLNLIPVSTNFKELITMPYVEDFGEFVARQNSESLGIEDGYLFANGAVWRADGRLRYEPPTDPVELAQVQSHYKQAKKSYLLKMLDDEVREFSRVRQEMFDMIGFARNNLSVPMPLPSTAAQLEAGKQRIESLQAQIAELETDYLSTAEGQAAVQAELTRMERNSQLDEIERAIRNVQCAAVNKNQEDDRYQRILAVQKAAQQQSLAFYSQLLGRR
jgi:hypothetical protein